MRHEAPDDDLGPPPGSVAAWTMASNDLDGVAPTQQRYQAGGELGRGGMGVVRAVTDAWLEREIAVKRAYPDLCGELANRLMREARITARLVHPAIPPVYDVGHDDEGWFYTMPVLLGDTLQRRLDDPVGAVVRVLAAVADAVGYAHDRGIVHRDIKPDNVLLGAHGEVWVLDWGVAFDPAEPDRALVGTRGFQAPEQRAGDAISPASDVYALGKILSVILGEGAHPALSAVARRCLAEQPDDRYHDGNTLALELHRWLDGQRVHAHAYSLREVLVRAARRWWAPLTVAAAASLIGLVAGGVALDKQRLERRRADRNLSVSLAHQASTLRKAEARPEAEVLAAASLISDDNPVARGVLMAWSGVPRPRLLSDKPPPCARPFLQEDGGVVCDEGGLRVLDAAGVLRWSAPASSEEATDIVVYGDSALVKRSSNLLEIWHLGRLVRTLDANAFRRALLPGPVPAFTDRHRVGRVALPSGEISWSPSTCDMIETARLQGEALLIGCRGPTVYIGSFDDPGEPIAVPGSASAVLWQDGPVIGTFQGQLHTRTASGWTSVASGVGGVRQLLPLGDGRLVVVGERGRARAWAPDGAFLGMLPEGVQQVGMAHGVLHTLGLSRRRYHLPASQPVSWQRVASGGLSYLALSPGGDLLLGGSASGEVVSWSVATGAVRVHRQQGPGAAKGGAFMAGGDIVFGTEQRGLMRVNSEGVAQPLASPPTMAVKALTTPGGLASIFYGNEVVRFNGVPQHIALPRRPRDLSWGGGLWVLDEGGTVYELDDTTIVAHFDLGGISGARRLAASERLVVTAHGKEVRAHDHHGELLWRWSSPVGITALALSERWVAVGDRNGQLSVLRSDGTLVATVSAHERLISALILRDDLLYSASWDGRVRRWGLEAVEASAQRLQASIMEDWGLSLDQALAAAGR